MRGSRAFVALALLALSVLAACGGSPPVTFSALPLFEGATELQPGQNQLADTVAESMKGAVGDQLTAEIKLYELPAAATWEEVQGFYTEQLSSTDWKAASEMSTETEAFNTVGWQRGSLASEQVLMVGYMPEMLGNAPVLIITLFSE